MGSSARRRASPGPGQVASFDLSRDRSLSSRRGDRGNALPRVDPRPTREVDAQHARPRQHGGHVEIRDTKLCSAEESAAAQGSLVHVERPRDSRLRVRRLLGGPLRRRPHPAVHAPDQQRPSELGDRPEAPLERAPLVLDVVRPEAAAVLAGEVERDRERFEELYVAVDQCGNVAVRVDRQEPGLAGIACREMRGDVLVRNAQLFEHPERTEGAGHRNAIHLNHETSSRARGARRGT